MKKAIIIAPSLLADIKRTSPAVYKYYNQSSFIKHELIDYGFEFEPMFMRLDVYFILVNFANNINMNISEIMDILQSAYRAGKSDLISHLSDSSYTLSFSNTANHLLNIALNEHYIPDSERCLIVNNNGKVFNKGTYMDGIYFQAWDQLFLNHTMHNDVFNDINKRSKKFALDYDSNLDFAYPLN